MLHKKMTKLEIEKELSGKGNFVQIDYLTRFLKEDLSIDTKKFVFLKLAEIYEKTDMLKDAAKNYENAAMVSITFREKIGHFMKEAELCTRAADFDGSEKAMKKAMVEANSMQRAEIYENVKSLYKQYAESFEKNLKRIHAIKAYEKLLDMRMGESEREAIKNRLLDLYEKLGRRKEYFLLKSRPE